MEDHLGSVTMITDGAGNVVSGGSLGGKANYLYRPYGEIDRMNSSGPDITKFKYTGQEEDKESGLYYYKARYYVRSPREPKAKGTEACKAARRAEGGKFRQIQFGGQSDYA